jgi:hypothetical protein
VAPPGVKSLDLLLPLEPVVADYVKPRGQIKIMSRLAARFRPRRPNNRRSVD